MIEMISVSSVLIVLKVKLSSFINTDYKVYDHVHIEFVIIFVPL